MGLNGLAEWWQQVDEQIGIWTEQAKEYFSDLNEMERYGWIAEGVGVALAFTGIILLIL